MKWLVACFNFLINIFWTGICFVPLVIFWFNNYQPLPFFSALLASFCFLFLPEAFFEKAQLNTSVRFYHRLGIKSAQAFTQNGRFINTIAKKIDPNYKFVRNKKRLLQLKRQIRVYEAFHCMCLVFFLLTSIYALILRDYISALIIIISNVVYNVVPILIQQYNRIRIR